MLNMASKLFGLLHGNEIEVNSTLPVNDETLNVSWLYRPKALESSWSTNVVVAAFMTTQSRLKLHKFRQTHKVPRMLYYDTDSGIYVGRPGIYDLPNNSLFLLNSSKKCSKIKSRL